MKTTVVLDLGFVGLSSTNKSALFWLFGSVHSTYYIMDAWFTTHLSKKTDYTCLLYKVLFSQTEKYFLKLHKIDAMFSFYTEYYV